MLEEVSIHLVLLGTQFHMSQIEKLQNCKSNLFCITSVSTYSNLPNTDLDDWSYSKGIISSLFEPDTEADITIGIIENKIEGNYFVRRLSDKSAVISFYQVEEIFKDSNIDVYNYLLVSVYELITLYRYSDNKISENSYRMVHDESRGCIFDKVGNKSDIVYSASNAHLCVQCEAKMSNQRLPLNFILKLKKELKKIRKSRYKRIVEFIQKRPLLSLLITALTSIGLNIVSSYLEKILFDN